MRFNITYTDYKNQNITSYFLTYRMNNEVKISIQDSMNYKMKMAIDTTRTFVLSDSINEYKDENGNIYYNIGLIQQLSKQKYSKKEKKINKICDCLYIHISKNIDDDNYNKMTFLVDEDKIHSLFDADKPIPDMIYSINIYDRIGIINRISDYRDNTNNSNT